MSTDPMETSAEIAGLDVDQHQDSTPSGLACRSISPPYQMMCSTRNQGSAAMPATTAIPAASTASSTGAPSPATAPAVVEISGQNATPRPRKFWP